MFGWVVEEEAGVALGLAIMMVVLIGVMGAGLLVFVGRDLKAVVEVNQGQRAFDLADAGVKAAGRELSTNPGTSLYDGGSDDSRWSYGKSGMNVGYPDLPEGSANVQITYRPGGGYYEVVSTGTVGEARRKIEARYAATGWGYEGYYTTGDVRIDEGAEINGVSFFSGRDIWLMNYDWSDYGEPKSGSRINVNTRGTKDALGNWDAPDWNTTPRKDKSSPSKDFEYPGFAAERTICKSSSCGAPGQSIADGLYGYDGTTGTKGSNKRFVRKEPADQQPQPDDRISYPFDVDSIAPAPETIDRWIGEAKGQGNPATTSKSNYINTRTDGYDDWNAIYGSSDPGTVIFVDGRQRGTNIPVKETAGKARGVLIGYCVDLTLEAPTDFQGVVIALKNDGCADRGLYKSNGATVRGYAYSQGDNPGSPAIHAAPNSQILPLPDGFQVNPVISVGVRLLSWRELYR